MARAARVLEEARVDAVEQGYLLMPIGIQSLEEGDVAGAFATFAQVAKIADRFRDPDLMALAALGRGAALIWLGETAEGTALLDEVLVAVTAGEVSPLAEGVVYCGAIEACWDSFDVRRATEWTAALTRWCAAHPDLVPYRGQCLVHRAEIMRLHGAWPEAEEEARQAGLRLSDRPAMGYALYLQGELHRLRGRFAEAEEAYRAAGEWGRAPQPGMARLRLDQGQGGAAAATIRRVLDEARDRLTRARLLGAYVDILLAAGDVDAARSGAGELSELAAELHGPFLEASSAYATGAVLLAEGDAQAACENLRRAWTVWNSLEAPYEVARTRVLMGLACHRLGDTDSARLERDAARRAFRRLGAGPDLARMERLWAVEDKAAEPGGGLTTREAEVLALVATGATNRAIAARLVLSEKTVARHLSNIFTKLGLSSRSAATAYAYEHGIVQL